MFRVDHLTSFALLLDGNGGSNSCSSSDFVLAWISLAFVLLALLLVIIGIIAAEIAVRYKHYNERKGISLAARRITVSAL